MTGPRTLVRAPVVRRPTGHDLDLIGDETEHIIATATLLERMADRVPGNGPEPSALAEGVQHRQVALPINESADHDTAVTRSREAWW